MTGEPGAAPSRLPFAVLVAVLLLPVVVAGYGLATSDDDGGGSPRTEIRSPESDRPVERERAVGRDDPREAGGVESPASGVPLDDLQPVLFGVAVEGADPELVAGIEAATGNHVGIVRVFARWDSEFPSADHRALLASGRKIHLSVRPRTESGRIVPWSEIATAVPGTAVHDEALAWALAVAPHGDQVYFTFNHEPETAQSAGSGTPEEFVAAWHRIVELIRSVGGDDVQTVLVLGRGPYETGEIERWYPGDDAVDVVGVDPYNWHRCQGTDRPWTAPRRLIDAALGFAEERGKPLAIPEIASTEDPGDRNRKGDWILDLAATLGSPEVADRLAFAAWFDVHDPTWPSCRWSIDSSAASSAAFATLTSSLTGP